MKTIGIIGGMSWQSTTAYYQLINESVARRLGGLHSADILLKSLDFEPVEQAQHKSDWDQCAQILIDAARCLEKGGADFGLIATNTMHKCFEQVTAAVDLEFIHIADPTGAYCQGRGWQRVGLLGTAFTMQEKFYRQRLQNRFRLEVLTPDEKMQQEVHRIIYQELCVGDIDSSSRQRYLDAINELYLRGAQAVILGCTEIGLLVAAEDAAIPLIDTTRIHAEAAVDKALARDIASR